MKTVEGWQKGRLGELCSIEIGGTPSRSNPDLWDASKDTSNLWVSIRDLNRTVITDTAEHISDSGVKHSNVKLQNSGTVLLSFKLSIGRVAFAGVPLYTNEAIAGLNSNKIDLNYLFHGLHHWDFLQGVDQAIKGATLNKEKLKRITFEYPKSTTEQAKIAEVLSTVDRAIEQTEALIAKQQCIKTCLMQDLLTRGIDEHGNLRSEQTHEFKDSPLGRIPVEWKVKSLSYFVKRLDAGISVNSDDKPCGSGQIGVLKTSALNKGDFLPEQNKTVLQIEENRVRVSPTANTILISRMNTPDLVGESGFVDKDYPHLFLPDRIWMTIFQDGKDKAARWLSFVIISPHARSYITLNATGTSGSMKNLPKASLFKMPLRAPTDPEEQQQIARLLECQNIQIEKMRQSLEKLRSLKTALMQDLLTGEVRVTPLLSEPQEAEA